MNWQYLRTFEAVARLGSLTAASRALGVSQSTVSRHLDKLEAEAGSPLLVRETPARLTERGRAVVEALQPMLDGSQAVRAALQSTPELRGEVTLTTVGELMRWVLAPQLELFYRDFPDLRLRVRVDNEVNSLAAGEADVALRIGRPQRGELIARRLDTNTWELFAASTLELHPGVPWLGLTGTLADIPEQHYAERTFASRPARLLIEDVETLGLAVEAGLGVALLPRSLADRLQNIVKVAPEDVGGRVDDQPPSRDIWLVVHRAKQRLPRVRAVIDWLDTCFNANR